MVIPNPDTGVTVSMLDGLGNGVSSFHGQIADFTRQNQTEPKGSPDWLREVWVAETQERLAVLKTALQQTEPSVGGTSGASAHVALCSDLHPETPGTPVVHADRYVIALGEPGPAPDGSTAFRAHTLLVSPVEIKAGHPLYPLWLLATQYLQNLIKNQDAGEHK